MANAFEEKDASLKPEYRELIIFLRDEVRRLERDAKTSISALNGLDSVLELIPPFKENESMGIVSAWIVRAVELTDQVATIRAVMAEELKPRKKSPPKDTPITEDE